MADKRSNILWICTDQQRFDTIGALGNPHVRTPHIDRLVGEGMAFTHAFCQSPICTPSRASFLTGMYPSSVRACTNGNDYWAGAAPLVTRLLAGAGYDCGLAGKLHLAGAHGRIEPRGDDGYCVFHWSHDPEDQWPAGHAYAEWIRSQGRDLGELRKDPGSIPPALHQTTWCTERALEFIVAEHDGPWLMSVNVFDPHGPLDPPCAYRERYDSDRMPGPLWGAGDEAAHEQLGKVDGLGRATAAEARQMQAAYYAMIELIDDNVGRLLAALEDSGQRQDTLVIFMSDHGEMLGDHGLSGKGCRFYEALVRVPLVLSQPGVLPQGLESQALVELIDLAPTLLEMAAVSAPERMQGRSLLPLLSGQSDPQHHRDAVRCEYYRALNPDVEGRDLDGTYANMIRDQRYKLVVYHDRDAGELFDLQEDPGEFNNLWDDSEHSALRFELMKKNFAALAYAVDVGPKQVTRF